MSIFRLRVTVVAVCALHGGLPAAARADVGGTIDALRDHPADVLSAPLGDERPGGDGARIVGYPFENVARFESGAQHGYVVSNMPLAVDGRPLDLAMRRDGAAAAPHAAPITLAVDLRGGSLTLRAPGQPSIGVQRAWGDAGAVDGEVVSGRVVLAGQDGDAGSVIQATASGAESFEVVEHAGQAANLQWRVSLPKGWMMTPTPAGAIRILDGGGAAAYVVAAPWARDAKGRGVPVSLALRGSDQIAATLDTDAATAFPIVVDPEWSSTYDFAAGDGGAGWFAIDEPVPGKPALGYSAAFTPFGTLPGIWVWPKGSTTDQYVNVGGDGEEVRGGTRFEAPGTTRIKRIDFGDTIWQLQQEDCSTHTYRDVDQYLRFVLRNRDADATTDDLQIGGSGGVATSNNVTPTSVPLLDPNQVAPTSTSASVTMWTEARTTASPKTIYPNPRPAASGCVDAVSPYVNVGRVDLTLVDVDQPTVSEVSGAVRDWADAAKTAWIGPDDGAAHQATGVIGLHDGGSGVNLRGAGEDAGHPDPLPALRATRAGGGQVVYDLSGGQRCDAHHGAAAMEGRICPETVTSQLTTAAPLDLRRLIGPEVPPGERDGKWTLGVTGEDLSGQGLASTPLWSYYVDATPPRVDWVRVESPPGQSVADRWIRATAADAGTAVRVQAQATDPSANGVASGVRSVGITWQQAGGGSTNLTADDEPQCTDAIVQARAIWEPCPATLAPSAAEFPRHLGSGHYVAQASAADFTGNKAPDPAQASAWVDSSAPQVAVSGSLADLDGAWIAPEDPAKLHVTATDPAPYASGVRDVSVTVRRGDGRELEPPTQLASCAAQPGDAGAATPPDPLCPTSVSGDASVDPRAWPDGRVEVSVDATDAVGNRAPRADADIVVHVDRQAPTVRLSGELTELASQSGWVAPSGSIGARVTAHDEGAGILRLEIWAKDERGTRLVQARSTCEPPPSVTGDTPPCPADVSEAFEIDPALVGDGTATFEARAIEYTGRIARIRETVRLDATPPPPVENLKITRVLGTAYADWTRPDVPPDSAPITGYVYAYVPAGQTDVTWTQTPSTSVPLPELPFEVAVTLIVCTVKQTGARSACRTASDVRPIEWGASAPRPTPTWAQTAQQFAPDIRMDPYERFFPISFSRVLDAGGVVAHGCDDRCKGKSVPWVMEHANEAGVSLDYPKSVTDPAGQYRWIEDREHDAGRARQKDDPTVYWSLSPEVKGVRNIYYWYYFAFNDYPLEPAIRNQLMKLRQRLRSAMVVAARSQRGRAARDLESASSRARRAIKLLIATFDHEGDWEYVRISVDAKDRTILDIGLSGHGKERLIDARSMRSELAFSGSRPQVWPANGSHAMQRRCGVPSVPPDIADALTKLDRAGETVKKAVRLWRDPRIALLTGMEIDAALAAVKRLQVLKDQAQCPPRGQEPYHHELSRWAVVPFDRGFRRQFGCFRGRLGGWPQVNGKTLGDAAPKGPLRQQPGDWAC